MKETLSVSSVGLIGNFWVLLNTATEYRCLKRADF